MRMVRTVALALWVTLFLSSVFCHAADWPLYRGPNQDGISREKVDIQWSGNGPKVVWRRPTNTGFSSFAVSNGKVFTQVVREIDGNPREICLALDAATGQELWFADIARGEGYSGGDTAGGGDGPRSTPTVNDGKVYVLTPDLVARCLDAETGRLLWKRDLMQAAPRAEHRLEQRGLGGCRRRPGLRRRRRAGRIDARPEQEHRRGRLEDRRRDHHPRHARGGHDPGPAAGDLLHEKRPGLGRRRDAARCSGSSPSASMSPRPSRPSSAATSSTCRPVTTSAARPAASSKQGGGFTATKLWFSPGNEPVVNHWSTPVCKDGYLYGMFGFKKFKNGPMKCVELATGKVNVVAAGLRPGKRDPRRRPACGPGRGRQPRDRGRRAGRLTKRLPGRRPSTTSAGARPHLPTARSTSAASARASVSTSAQMNAAPLYRAYGM